MSKSKNKSTGKLKVVRGKITAAISKILSKDATISDVEKVKYTEKIADLKISDEEYLFDLDDNDNTTKKSDMRAIVDLYNMAFIIQEIGTEKTVAYLENFVVPKLREILLQKGTLEDQHSVLIFDSHLLEKPRHREEMVLRLNDDKGPLSDMASCGRCGADRVYITTKQTRKADEGATSLFECGTCGTCWTDKGS